MATVYLLQPGTIVRKDRGRFAVCLPEGSGAASPVEILIRDVERILVFGNVQLTTPVIHACFEKEIPVVMSSERGEYRGHLCSLDAIALPNQVAQLERRKDKEFQLEVSRALVRGKLLNSKQLLLRLNRKRQLPEVAEAIANLDSDISAVDRDR